MATTLPALRPVQGIPLSTTPLIDCAWCWPLLHPDLPYPEQWSSTICETHSAWMLERHVQLRVARKHATKEIQPC